MKTAVAAVITPVIGCLTSQLLLVVLLSCYLQLLLIPNLAGGENPQQRKENGETPQQREERLDDRMKKHTAACKRHQELIEASEGRLERCEDENLRANMRAELMKLLQMEYDSETDEYIEYVYNAV